MAQTYWAIVRTETRRLAGSRVELLAPFQLRFELHLDIGRQLHSRLEQRARAELLRQQLFRFVMETGSQDRH